MRNGYGLQDIVVPGLKVDWETMKLRLHWRDLFLQFFSTENKSGKLSATNLKTQYETAREMKAQIAAGLLEEGEAFNSC